MNIKNVFRTIIIINFLTLVLSAITPFLPIYSEDEKLITLLEYNGYGSSFNIDLSHIFIKSIFGIILVVGILSNIAIYFFKKWARVFYIGFSMYGILISPFGGLIIFLALDYFFYNIYLITLGVIFTMMYLEPISSEFNKKSEVKNTETQPLSKPKVL